MFRGKKSTIPTKMSRKRETSCIPIINRRSTSTAAALKRREATEVPAGIGHSAVSLASRKPTLASTA
jgi:hypothetical protein